MTWDKLAPNTIGRLSTDLNLTQQQAAGIVGHLGYESDGLQAINERNPVVPGSRGGFGWAQWTGPRRRQFESWAEENKADITDPESNYQFLLHELTNTPESRVLEDLRKAGDAQTAGRIFTDQFLRPGVPAHEKRVSWVEKALNTLVPAAQANTTSQAQSMKDRINQARAAGFSDEEILQRIQQNADMAARIQKAKDAGFSDDEIFGRMGIQLPPAEKNTDAATGNPMTINMAHEEQQNNGASGSWEAPPRSLLEETGRQGGLAARAALSGVTALPNMLWNGPAGVVNWLSGDEVVPLADSGTTADWLGLPKPESSRERVVQDVSSAMAGAGGVNAIGKLMQSAARPLTKGIGGLFGEAPILQTTTAAASAGASGGAREAGFGEGVQTAAGLTAGLVPAGATSTMAHLAARSKAIKNTPTVRQLKDDAANLYNEAEQQGVTASQQQTQTLAREVRDLAQEEGLISPTGRVSEAYPKAREALRMLDDYSLGEMSVPQMQTARKVLSDAVSSSDSAERRIATIMLQRFDDFTTPLAPQLAKARSLYTRAKKGEQLETLRELAMNRTGQFSGSGYENALRTEYRGLSNKIEKGTSIGWSEAEKKAIERVTRGDTPTNIARNIGRFAPTGVISAGLTGGVPYMVGNSIGGPAVGSAAMGAALFGSLTARDLATRMSLRNAEMAELLARSGGNKALKATLPMKRLAQILRGTAIGQATLSSD